MATIRTQILIDYELKQSGPAYFSVNTTNIAGTYYQRPFVQIYCL